MSAKLSPAKVRKLWAKELRSGKWTQGYWQLKRRSIATSEPTHCCLGVLCELAVKHGVVARFKSGGSYPPKAVERWAGLTHDELANLSHMNDCAGKAFEEIACAIETNPIGDV